MCVGRPADLIDASSVSSGANGDGASGDYTGVSYASGAGNGATVTPNGGDTGKTLLLLNAGQRWVSGSNGVVSEYGSYGRFWPADQSNTSNAWYLCFSSAYPSGRINGSGKLSAFSIRCVRS